MARTLTLLMALLVCAPAIAAEPVPFPRPAALEPRVRFWTRIYTEVGTDGGLVHDPENMNVVYEVVRFPDSLTRRGREHRVRDVKERYEKVLHTLARGKRENLSHDERRVLALWPEGVSSETLRSAARRIRFQLGQADKFRAGLIRSGAWEGYIRRTFAEHRLPPDLAVLPHVESSFNPAANSHAGATGIWQFTRSTGRLFMRIDHVVDERRDPFLSTVAAGRLLRENYEKTRTWPLAITAYNHGASGMKRAVEKLGTREIATIVEKYESRSFGFASRNFYAEFLAARDVVNDSTRYFGVLTRDPPADPEIVVLDHHYRAKTLAHAFGVPLDLLRQHNLALLSPVWEGSKHVPKRYGLRVPRDPNRQATRVILASIPGSERFAKQKPDLHYRVRRGDTLSRIARRFHVRESELVTMNGLRSRHRIRIGQVLRLPVNEPGRAVGVAREPVPPDGLYRIRRGDTLSVIARRFGVSEQDLVALNHLPDRDRIHARQLIQLPLGRGGASGASTRAGEPATYRVQRGDSLWLIARRHGVGANEIAALNRLPDRNRLRVGQTLHIPRSAKATSRTPDPKPVSSGAGPAVPAVAASRSEAAPAWEKPLAEGGEAHPAPPPAAPASEHGIE
jgi:membrane-bound lytic murein transglycosylase D